MKDTTDIQFRMCDTAATAPAKRWEAFMEIMNGPNSLTDDEIRALALRRPEYSFVLAYLKEKP
jgi:hypothetical protein